MRQEQHLQKAALESEFREIQSDQSSLRNDIFRMSTDEQIHLPVNVARLIWNAKAQFGIKANSKSDLKPSTVTSKL